MERGDYECQLAELFAWSSSKKNNSKFVIGCTTNISGNKRRYDANKKVQLDATVCRHLFTAQSLYIFRVSQHPSSGVLKTVSATSGIGHDTGTATSFQRGLIRPRWKEIAVPVS